MKKIQDDRRPNNNISVGLLPEGTLKIYFYKSNKQHHILFAIYIDQ